MNAIPDHVHFARATAVAARPVRPLRAQRPFDLHPALFIGTIACYAAFLLVMGATFMVPGLVLPFAICAICLVAAFLVPGLWLRVVPKSPLPAQRWDEFLRDGIETGSGHLSGGAAVAQVLTVPVLIALWAVMVSVIHVLV